MKKLLLLFCLLGCDPRELNGNLVPTASQEASHIEYAKDGRTGLCFVVSYVSEYPLGTATIFNNVPCTPEVEKLIAEQHIPKATK
jgi:hypothetical protein